MAPRGALIFFSASATLKFISKVVQQITKNKGQSDRSCACRWSLRPGLNVLRCFEGTFAVGQQRRGCATWHLPLSLREQNKLVARAQNAGTPFERYSRPNSQDSSREMPAQRPPWGFEHPQRCVWKRLCLQSEAGGKALPSAMRCSGTCRITRTERLQER